jgi:riboflavin synthase
MFTGLVETLGRIERASDDGAGGRHLIVAADFASELTLGESVAVNGVCLTVVERDAQTFRFQAGPETLQRSNLGELVPGDRVNLERSLRLSDRLGGHLVQGHVDGLGRVAARATQADWETFWFTGPADLVKFLVSKGSVAVDGISLTVVDVTRDEFSVALIPHTLAVTTLGFKQPGASVNLEMDVLAKYLYQWAAQGYVALPSRREG